MKENLLVDLSRQFAIDIVNLCREIRANYDEKILTNQLLRSGTSIGANLHEGNYASSRLDFINKFQIALKECYETEYWLKILVETKYLRLDKYNKYNKLNGDCSKLRKLLFASIVTAQKNDGADNN